MRLLRFWKRCSGSHRGTEIKAAAKTGAAYGALQNPGDVEEVNLILYQISDRAQNAAVGAVTGAVVQGGVEGAAKALNTKSLVKKGAEL